MEGRKRRGLGVDRISKNLVTKEENVEFKTRNRDMKGLDRMG